MQVIFAVTRHQCLAARLTTERVFVFAFDGQGRHQSFARLASLALLFFGDLFFLSSLSFLFFFLLFLGLFLLFFLALLFFFLFLFTFFVFIYILSSFERISTVG